MRGVFVGIYVIVGVPLFAFTLGQFAGMIVESAIREREMQIMARPLGENEFKFALTLKRIPKKVPTSGADVDDDKGQHNKGTRRVPAKSEKNEVVGILKDNPPDSLGIFLSNRSAATGGTENGNTVRFTSGRSNIMRPRAYSESCIIVPGRGINTQGPKNVSEAESAPYPEFSIDFGEFVVLEMLRLRRVDEHDLGAIRNLFDDIDYDSAGQIDEAKLERFSKLLNSKNEVEIMQESGKSALTDSRKSHSSVDYKDCESPMSISGHEILLIPEMISAISPSKSTTFNDGDTFEEASKDRLESFDIPSTRESVFERKTKGSVTDTSPKEREFSFRINGDDNMNRSKRAFTAEIESESLPLLSPSDFRANDSDNQIGVTNAFYALPSNSNDAEAVCGTSIESDSSLNSQDSNFRAKRTLTHAYNQLLMPIIRMRQLRHNSASISRPTATNDTSREGTPTTTIRKLSIDMDALGDSDCDDGALKRAGSWWFRSQTPADDDAERRGRSVNESIASPTLEEGCSTGEDNGSGSGGWRLLGGPEVRTHTDLVEEGIRKVFGYSKYGAMNTIDEEIV